MLVSISDCSASKIPQNKSLFKHTQQLSRPSCKGCVMQKLRYSSLLYDEMSFILLSEFASRVTPTRSLSEVWSALLLYFHRVWLVSALTSSRVTSRCILGFQATSFTHATPTRLAKRRVIGSSLNFYGVWSMSALTASRVTLGAFSVSWQPLCVWWRWLWMTESQCLVHYYVLFIKCDVCKPGTRLHNGGKRQKTGWNSRKNRREKRVEGMTWEGKKKAEPGDMLLIPPFHHALIGQKC